jgi:polyhydroxybutyrate depolymerase
VLNFHGYTSNNLEQMFYGDFRPIADTAGFLVVHPMGTTDLLGNPHWNVGWGTSSVDDVAFTSALIDSLAASYTINQDRIYSTGMSNGGFFSYYLACNLSDRIAAIASVTGSMNNGQTANCNTSHPMPVMEIHGTADDVVAYDGNILFAPIPNVVSFWVDRNSCSTPASFTAIPDTDQSDACTAEHYFYADGLNGSTVEHFKIIGGAHTWPGSAFGGAGTNQDIDASREIWRFFSQYDIHGRIGSTSAGNLVENPILHFFPNPASQYVYIENHLPANTPYTLSNAYGQRVFTGRITTDRQEVNLSGLPDGMYVMTIGQTAERIFKINR